MPSVIWPNGMSLAKAFEIKSVMKGLHMSQASLTATLAVFVLGIGTFWINQPAAVLQETTKPVTQQSGQDDRPKRDDNASLYMQAKLSNAQKVLGGLVSEDFDAIASGASNMKMIAEAAHWPTTIDEVYQHYSVEFRRQCDKLHEQAKKKDLRAAHFTYLHMSTTCIDCHDYVRKRFEVKRTHDGPVRLIPTDWEGRARKLPTPVPDEEDDKDT